MGTIECYTEESSSQLILALIDKFGPIPNPEDIEIVCCDVACGLHKFLAKRAPHNDVLSQYYNLEYVLDAFHRNKHTEEECMPGGRFNVRSDKFKYLFGANLEAAESSFKGVNKFKNTLNYMTAGKRMVFLALFEDAFNYKKYKGAAVD